VGGARTSDPPPRTFDPLPPGNLLPPHPSSCSGPAAALLVQGPQRPATVDLELVGSRQIWRPAAVDAINFHHRPDFFFAFSNSSSETHIERGESRFLNVKRDVPPLLCNRLTSSYEHVSDDVSWCSDALSVCGACIRFM
jgi:hypothetical protein